MATLQGTEITGFHRFITYTWTGFAASGDVGTSITGPHWPDKTVQAFGTFTGSLGITIEGTNDSGETSWATLHDNQGNALVLTDNSVKFIEENPLRIRARATAGSGGASASVVIVGYK